MAEQHELDACIDRWRTALSGLSAEQVSELEDHVRAECARLADGGLNDEERVLIASRRLGQPQALEAGFCDSRVAPRWRRIARLTWWTVAAGLLLTWLYPACREAIEHPGSMNPWSREMFNFWRIVLPGVLLAGWLSVGLIVYVVARVTRSGGWGSGRRRAMVLLMLLAGVTGLWLSRVFYSEPMHHLVAPWALAVLGAFAALWLATRDLNGMEHRYG